MAGSCFTKTIRVAYRITASFDETRLLERNAFRIMITKALLKLAARTGKIHISIEIKAEEEK